MAKTRANEADKAVALIRGAIETVEHLEPSPREGVRTNGIATLLTEAIRRIEAVRDKEGH